MNDETRRDGFVFYRSFANALRRLPKKHQLTLLWAIVDYALDAQEPPDDPAVSACWELIRPQIDANNKRYRSGRGGGRPRKTTVSSQKLKTTGFENEKPSVSNLETTGYEIEKPKDKDKEKDKDKDKDKEKDKDKDKGTANGSQSASGWPSLSDVVSYGRATGSRANAAKFWQLNQNRGWKINGEPIRDWRKLFDSWSRSEREPAAGQRSGIDFDAVTPSIGQNVGGATVDLPEPYRDDDGIEYVDFGGGGT